MAKEVARTATAMKEMATAGEGRVSAVQVMVVGEATVVTEKVPTDKAEVMVVAWVATSGVRNRYNQIRMRIHYIPLQSRHHRSHCRTGSGIRSCMPLFQLLKLATGPLELTTRYGRRRKVHSC